MLKTCRADLPNDFHFTLICTRESRCRSDHRARGSREAKKSTFETSTGCNTAWDGWPGDGTLNCLCSCTSTSPLHHSSWLTLLSKLHFALNDATHWMSHYNGFNYEEFYEFIIDFLEEDQTPAGKAASNELFAWWNQCVPMTNLLFPRH